MLTNPLWVVNSRLKMSGVKRDGVKYKGVIDCFLKIILQVQTKQFVSKNNLENYVLWQEGVLSLWNGTKASLMLVSNPAIKFTVYELLKRQFSARGRGGNLAGIRAFVLGCVATAAATVLTYPVQMLQVSRIHQIRHSLQHSWVQAKARHNSSNEGMLETAQRIVKQSGIKGKMLILLNFSYKWSSMLTGLYRGLDSKLVQSMAGAGLMFMSYENIVQAVTNILNKELETGQYK